MESTRIRLIIVASLLIVVAHLALFGQFYCHSHPQACACPTEGEPLVATARKPLHHGQILRLDHLKMVHMKREAIPKGALKLRDLKPHLGRHVIHELPKGKLVAHDDLENP